MEQQAQQHQRALAAARAAALEAQQQHQQQLQDVARAAAGRLEEELARLRGGYEQQAEQLRQQLSSAERAKQVGTACVLTARAFSKLG